jgi:membrane protease YdiL (CAAX protease family)
MVLLNQRNLDELNIDKQSLKIFMVAGLLISLFYLPPYLGIITGLCTFIIFRVFLSNGFQFEIVKPSYQNVFLVFIAGLLPAIILFLLPHKASAPLGEALLYASLPDVVIEEIIFRGLLWAYLKKSNFEDSKILYIQAFLFWFGHVPTYWDNPFQLWFWTPAIALWLGLLVKRSKSITLSIAGHFLYNLLAILTLGGR